MGRCTDLRRATNTFPAAPKVSNGTAASIILTQVFPELTVRPGGAICGKGEMVRDVTKNPSAARAELQGTCVPMENVYTLHQCSVAQRQSNLSVPHHEVVMAGIVFGFVETENISQRLFSGPNVLINRGDQQRRHQPPLFHSYRSVFFFF